MGKKGKAAPEPEEEEPEPDFGKKKKKGKAALVEEDLVVEEVEEEPDFGKKKKKGKVSKIQEESVSSSAPSSGIVVGLIEELEKHPKKDKYTICQVRVAANRKIQTVCTIPVSLNKKYSVAVAPTTVQGHPVEARQIQKFDSEGMFLGPNELEWAEGHGFDCEVPVPLDEFEVGTPVPSLQE